MATDLQRVLGSQVPHTSGIYADTLLDGDEIGTLVVIIDRAKNLPNRKTMGKQDPYCAARLGKEAQKTNTDRRGGQTPKWDQELRFAVHESPDYHNLKLSVFNDDKRAELIGETWINLDEVLQRGGGKSDSWHTLSCRNKYAGDILIELTYYDSRARLEKGKDYKRERKASVIEAENADSSKPTLGPRQQPVIKRRPLPNDPANGVASPTESLRGSGQMAQAFAPDSFDQYSQGQQAFESQSPRNTGSRAEHTSSVQKRHPTLEPNVGHQVSLRHPSPQRKLVQGRVDQQDPYTTEPQAFEGEDNLVEYTDDPYALQAVHAENDFYNEPAESSNWAAQPRHHRIDALATTPVTKPYHPPLPHAQSAPVLGDHAHSPQYRNQPDEYNDDYYQAGGSSPPYHDPYSASPGYTDAQDYRHSQNNQTFDLEPSPPPPPMHRNSAPPAAIHTRRTAPIPQTRAAPRPLHTAASTGGLRPGQQHYMNQQAPPRHGNAYADPRFDQPPHTPNQRPEWRHSSGPSSSVRPSTQQHSNSRQLQGPPYEYDAVFSEPQWGGNQPNRFINERRQSGPQPLAQYGGNVQQYSRNLVPTPQGRSPVTATRANSVGPQLQNTPAQRTLTPRKSVDPQSPYAQQSTPYSPDSYGAPSQRSKLATPIAAHTPSPGHSPHPPTPNGGQPTPPAIEASPILRSDGQAVDPADQLPVDSWAPEPERKGGSRPSVVVNVKRFGPRSAPSTPLPVRPSAQAGGVSPGSPHTPNIAASPAAGAARARGLQPSPRGNSPLTPSSQHALNSNSYSGYPPPVPNKIPLEYNGGNNNNSMSAMSQEMQNLDLNQYGRTASGQRVRRSRFGA